MDAEDRTLHILAGCGYCCNDNMRSLGDLFSRSHYLCHSCGDVGTWGGADPECCGDCGSPQISYEEF